MLLMSCATVPEPLQMPPSLEESPGVPVQEVAAVEETVEEPAGGVRLFFGEEEVRMGDLAGGAVPAGSLIEVVAGMDVKHSVISEMLMRLHGMGYLVGVRAAGASE